MRVLFAAMFVVLPVLAAAQSSQSGTSVNPTLPSIGLPLPDIGLPLGPPETPRANKPNSRGERRSPPARRQPRGDERRGDRARGRTVYLVPAYPAWNYPVSAPEAPAPPAAVNEPEPAPPPEPVRPTGTLSLDVEPPGTAQVFVDNFYVGTINDVGRELTLDAGTHNVELRASGYETLNVNVKIDPGRNITYRGSLQPVAGKAASASPDRAAEAAPAKRKPIYAIPGCYLGDVPPKEAGLPPTCDPRKAITIRP